MTAITVTMIMFCAQFIYDLQSVINPFTTEPLAVFLELETDNLGVIH